METLNLLDGFHGRQRQQLPAQLIELFRLSLDSVQVRSHLRYGILPRQFESNNEARLVPARIG
jgi:hypothetical protein